MEDSSNNSHHHDDTWVEPDPYRPDYDINESKRRKGSTKVLIIRAAIVLVLILLAILLGWLKS